MNQTLYITSRSRHQRGAALLVVLFLVMVSVILGLGFLSKSDVELACGKNMQRRICTDSIAESALEHARGLILHPQEVSYEYWTGGNGLQLDSSSHHYYDVQVVRSSNTEYDVTASAYELSGGVRKSESNLSASLRLNPCVVLGTGSDLELNGNASIAGDVYCDGTINNAADVNGDAYSSAVNGGLEGKLFAAADCPVSWPTLDLADYSSEYTVQLVSSLYLKDTSLGAEDTVVRRDGDLMLIENVTVNGMLIVDGNLRIAGTGNRILHGKNLPGLYVTGDLILEKDAELEVDGLVVVDDDALLIADSGELAVNGAILAQEKIALSAADASSRENFAAGYGEIEWLPSGGAADGAVSLDGNGEYFRVENSWIDMFLWQNFTFAFYLNADAVQNGEACIFMKTNTAGSSNHYGMQFDNSADPRLLVRFPSDTWDTGITLSMIAGAWHHIRVVKQGTSIASYLDFNPAAVNSGTWIAMIGFGSGHINIGTDRTADAGKSFRGMLDDLRIYNTFPMGGGTYPPDLNLIGWWKFDESNSVTMEVTASPSDTAIWYWDATGNKKRWMQASDAFYAGLGRE